MKKKPTKSKPSPKPKAQKKTRPDFAQVAFDVVKRVTGEDATPSRHTH